MAKSQPRSRRALAIGGGVIALALLAYLVWPKHKPRHAHTTASTTETDDDDSSGEARAAPGGTAMQDLAASAWDRSKPPPDDSQWRQRMEDTKKAYLQKSVYPPDSLPLANKTDLIPPHHVE